MKKLFLSTAFVAISIMSLNAFADDSHEDAESIAQETIDAINQIKPSANYAQLGRYLLPIRKSAASLKVVANVRSPYDAKVRSALIRLRTKIESAKPYIEESLETDTNFYLATEFMRIEEQIDYWIR